MTLRPSTVAVRLGAWLFASCVAAELSHAGIEAAGRIGAGGTYEGREHGSIAVVALGAIVFASTTLVAAVILRLRSADAPAGRVRLSPFAVILGSFGMLLGMEFVEQIAACGRIEGVGDALGGNVCAGAAIVLVAAACVYRFGTLLASPIVRSAARAAGVLAGWIGARDRDIASVSTGTFVPGTGAFPRSPSTVFLARSLGERAPPLDPLFA
jgi:hypothetical protein